MRSEWLIQTRTHDGARPWTLGEYCERCWSLVVGVARSFGEAPQISCAGGHSQLVSVVTAKELERVLAASAEEGEPLGDDSVKLRQSTGFLHMTTRGEVEVRMILSHIAVEGVWPAFWRTQDLDVRLRRGGRVAGSARPTMGEAWFDLSVEAMTPTWARLVTLRDGAPETFFSGGGDGYPMLGWLTYLDPAEYPSVVHAWSDPAAGELRVHRLPRPWDRDNHEAVIKVQGVLRRLSDLLVPAVSSRSAVRAVEGEEEDADDLEW